MNLSDTIARLRELSKATENPDMGFSAVWYFKSHGIGKEQDQFNANAPLMMSTINALVERNDKIKVLLSKLPIPRGRHGMTKEEVAVILEIETATDLTKGEL